MALKLQTYFPTFRQKILKSFLVVIAGYVLLGFLLIGAVFFTSGLTPKLIHVNYDSIEAANQMRESWSALQDLQNYSWKSSEEWKSQFEEKMRFEEGNITEPGERETAQEIRKLWESSKNHLTELKPEAFTTMFQHLDRLISANKNGMFRLADESRKLSQRILYISLAFFFLTVLLTVILADNLSNRLAHPIKKIVEILRRKPSLEHPLKLPEPNTFELSILNHQLMNLWDQLSSLNKLNLKQLVAQRNQLESVLSSVEDGILVINNEDKVVLCNEGMASLFELEVGQVLHQPWRDLPILHPNYFLLRDFLKPDLSSNNSLELQIGGLKLILAARYRRIAGENNEAIGSLYLLHDITQKAKFRQMREEWIGMLSHELKTPLQSLGTASELLVSRKDRFDEESKMLLETLHDDVERIRTIVTSFTQMIQSETQALKLHLKKTQLNQALEEWIKPFQIVAKDKGIRIELFESEEPRLWANLDQVKFPWILSNLLSNAIRVSPSQSEIRVTLSSDEKMIFLEVADEGAGIPPDVEKRIFEAYYQGPAMEKYTQGFLGIGLTIAKEVVEAHEGKIEYRQNLPQGAIFKISIPKAGES